MAATAQQPQQPQPQAERPTPRRLVERIGERYGVDSEKLLTTLKATAFRQRADRQGNVREPTNEEMMALLVIADQYHLNPFTREIFAYYDPKNGAIIAVVSVDGWLRIINEQPSLRSLEIRYGPQRAELHKGKTVHEWMEIEIVRSDRDKPVVIREYFDEVVRNTDFATPWDTHPNRMHRHKTIIQGGRVAFGFGGIYDEDEASRIIEGTATVVTETSPAVQAINRQIENKPVEKVVPPVVGKPAEKVVAAAGEPKTVATSSATSAEPPAWQYVIERIDQADGEDGFGAAADLIRTMPEGPQRESAQKHFDEMYAAFKESGAA